MSTRQAPWHLTGLRQLADLFGDTFRIADDRPADFGFWDGSTAESISALKRSMSAHGPQTPLRHFGCPLSEVMF